MSLMRTYRAALALSQSAFAARLNVPLETYRTWDSGRREPSKEVLSRARTLAAHPDDTVLLSLQVLALMIGVHVRTLQAAARFNRRSRSSASKVPVASCSAGPGPRRRHGAGDRIRKLRDESVGCDDRGVTLMGPDRNCRT